MVAVGHFLSEKKYTYVTFLVYVQALQKACNAEPVYLVPVHKIRQFVQSVSLGNFMYTYGTSYTYINSLKYYLKYNPTDTKRTMHLCSNEYVKFNSPSLYVSRD